MTQSMVQAGEWAEAMQWLGVVGVGTVVLVVVLWVPLRSLENRITQWLNKEEGEQ